MRSVRDGRLTLAEKRAREREVLARCRIDDFEVIEVIGDGSNSMVISARCLNADNPFWRSKEYALKGMFNMFGLDEAELLRRQANDFELWSELESYRRGVTASGKGAGLVEYYGYFIGEVPEALLELVRATGKDLDCCYGYRYSKDSSYGTSTIVNR